ncbi:Fe-S-cluster-containing dehydrogenase component [Paenibacillus phyllosphaerae]|uniref:Fe-S-cluster-containing dehydrogenase component n=1 Tax=Paenibacillus phyllosphaerae TaxID=274593 RepID=A0A7W5FN62_9BACL|nr:4Fe-4S dicluster domain-containing protein [Paenibacillus phyllosphaerae]MBB3110950.1 Fe-S-cluster-containing dehydrogenase component [Paenibacillus phyllosphaerae]
MPKVLYIDFERCIGCRACVIGCEECSGHDHLSRMFVDELTPGETVATSPTPCMHCYTPLCAESCPVQAIQVMDGVVLSASHEKCIGCKNCTYACPFGIPRVDEAKKLMYKCDMCYDRTSKGRPPMCVSVCPTDTIQYVDEEVVKLKNSKPVQYQWQFGATEIETRTVIGLPDLAGHKYGYYDAEESDPYVGQT